jgi:hypothetical protein
MIPAFWNGQLYVWTPYPGIDPSLLSRHLLIGATVYAKNKANGMSERLAHIEAEKAAFADLYGIRVGTS